MPEAGDPAIAYVGLGGNLGRAEDTLPLAFPRLQHLPSTRLRRVSRLYRTPAWGLRDQPDFVNAVAELETALSPHALLDALLAIEHEFGRRRAADGSDRWGPRVLDLDILLYGRCVIDEPGLRLPHPHLHERAFALVPLLELVGDYDIPGHGSARAALAAIADEGIQALG